MNRILALLLFFSIFKSAAQSTGIHLPFILQDEQKLSAYKQLYNAGDKDVKDEVDSLVEDANKILNTGSFSVTFQKNKIPPSGDLHDYVSQAPYWWPDSSRPDGRPYIRRDGRINPEEINQKTGGKWVK